MNIKDLKYLVALADCGHFGHAARACFVSQPALSMQIKKLEETLGVQLLERTNKSVMLTEYGVIIADRARQILSQVNEVHEIAKLAKDPLSGECRLGVIPTLAPYLLPKIMPKLTKAFPKITFFLVEEQTAKIIEKLKQGHLHAAIIALPIGECSFEHKTLFEEEFYLAVSQQHAFAKLKKITSNHLHDESILLLEDGHCLRDQALTYCERVQAKEAHNFRATSLETLRHMVAAGVGMTLMPKLACTPMANIAYIPFAQPKPVRSIALFWRATSAKQVLLQKMIREIKTVII